MKLKSLLVGALALGCASAFGGDAKEPVSKSGQESVVVQKLQTCDFLLNKDFKKNAKYYLCLFSASWCPPCRAEMPRIAKTYAEQLKADPDIELIHFSRDQNDEKALAWAKEHDVKFPVVKPQGGNPLDLRCNGIPHIFIVQADGTLADEGHPAGVFTEEKICALTGKTGKASVDGYTWSYCAKNGEAMIVATGKNEYCAVSPRLAGNVAIPSTLDGLRVTRIGRCAFQYCRQLTSVTIPKGVTTIGENAFCQCEGLTSVTIPDGVIRIGGRAFSGCRKLSSVSIPSSVMSIGDWAFVTCDKLPSVMIPKGVTQIGIGVFSECNEMTRIDVEAGNQKYGSIGGVLYTKDGKSLVACPGGLASVTVPSSVCDIQKFSISGCVGLKRIDVATDNPTYASSDGVLYTKDKTTLLACPGGMSSVAIPQGVKDIGEFAFRNCRKLSSVTFPASVASIGWSAFSGCSALSEVTIPSGVTILPGYAFQNCSGLTSLTIPSSVKRIAHRAFGGCGGLKSLSISEGVTRIDSYAFTSCAGLTSVVIPSSIKHVDRDAFCYCRNLASVTMLGERPNAQDGVFRSCNNLTEIHVPANAKSWARMKEWQGKPLVFDGKAIEGVDRDAVKPASVTAGGSSSENAVAEKLQSCDFLLNKDFKKNAKYYLCLFSASWCPPCRAEMPRIAKTYAEQLKADPDIELIHFSRDQNDEKALAWAKEHDVKFPVVKPKGGNPLELHSNGIPHLFIVKADGTLMKEDHPSGLFTDENLRSLKAGTFAAPETATENPAKSETATEKTRKAIVKLFPGWSLDTEVFDHDFAGIRANHRGLSNVAFVHPKNQETPAIVSRTMTLSDKNPCLFLKVASWNEEADYLLSVRVNGKEILPSRLVCTPDIEPWQDLTVSLADWRGNKVKIEVVIAANNWWCENPMLARLEIAEGKGDMRITEGTETVNGYTWSYRAQNGEATIVAEKDGKFSRAVSPCPIGHLAIPATLGGAKVTRIGREAFADCSAMTAVTIPEGVTRIGRRAFHDCTGLRSVKLPSSVKTLEWDAFGRCRAMTSVTLPDGLKSIDRGAFYDCYALTSVTMPSSVTYLGQDAFLNCRSLASVTISSGVTDLRLNAFRGCNALTSVTIPASVTNIDKTAFCDTGALTSFHVDDGNRFYKSENGLLLTKDGKTLIRGVNGDVKIPSSVTAIGPCAFEGCVSLRPIVIPNGVKSIGDYAFKQCRGMTAVAISDGVTSIGFQAFNNCKGLLSVAIPESVTSIGSAAFAGSERLTEVKIPQSVTVIRDSTFTGTALTNVTIPAGVKTLERGVFSWCGVLKTVLLPEGLTSIGRDVFYNCRKLESLTIPASVQRIEQGAFHGCGSLTSLTIPSTLANIDRTAFDGCSKLKSVNVVKDGKTETISFTDFCKERNLGQQSRLLGRGAQRPGLLIRNRPRNQQAVPAACPQPRNAEMEEQRRQLQEIQAQLKALKAEQDRMKAERSSGK